MFTGIVEEVGRLAEIARSNGDRCARVVIEAPVVSDGVRLGDSVAVNGACLTVVSVEGVRLGFDAVPETVERTSLKAARPGDGVNLERPVQAGARMGGHYVQGHVDGVARLAEIDLQDNARVLRLEPPRELMRYIIPKGSVALDGISLTVAGVTPTDFTVWIIPHTLANTNLRDRRIGDGLNIETDVLARYAEKLLEGVR